MERREKKSGRSRFILPYQEPQKAAILTMLEIREGTPMQRMRKRELSNQVNELQKRRR